MIVPLITLIDRLDSMMDSRTDIIPWASPVVSFGDPSVSVVATLGINPSDLEFTNSTGAELQGRSRRFETLASLGITRWSEVDARHLTLILESSREYFHRQPYVPWFQKLEPILEGLHASYYAQSAGTIQPALFARVTAAACHLDLIPYATLQKWNHLTPTERSILVATAHDTLSVVLRDSSLRVLILNGRAVVELFEDVGHVRFERQEMQTWSLPRRDSRPVTGIAFSGLVDKFAGVQLDRQILILGYNHNLQSSFGVTNRVIMAIRDWIAAVASEAIR
jgi:hypothetical protein